MNRREFLFSFLAAIKERVPNKNSTGGMTHHDTVLYHVASLKPLGRKRIIDISTDEAVVPISVYNSRL